MSSVQTVLFSDGRRNGFLDEPEMNRHARCEALNHTLYVYSEGYYCPECDAFFRLGYWGDETIALPSDVTARMLQGCRSGVCEL